MSDQDSGMSLSDLLRQGAKPRATEASLAELKAAGAKPTPDVDWKETLLNNTVNMFPGAGRAVDLASGVARRLAVGEGVNLTPQAVEEAKAAGVEVGEQNSLLNELRKARDTRRERDEAGGRQNPNAALAGKALGFGLSLASPLPAVKVGSGVLGGIGSAALTGAGYGTFNAVADGKADLTKGEFAQAGKDIIGIDEIRAAAEEAKAGNPGKAALLLASAGATGGAVVGGVLGTAMELLRAIPGVTTALNKIAVAQARRVHTNGADQLSGRGPIRAEAMLESLDSGAVRAGGTTEGTMNRLEKMSREQGELYGRIVQQLEDQGVKGPDIDRLATQYMEEAAKRHGNTGSNKAIPKRYAAEAENLRSIERGENPYGPAEPQTHLRPKQGEDIKRALQDEAYYGKVEETPLNDALQDIASRQRAANEEAFEGAAGRLAGPEGKQGRLLIPGEEGLRKTVDDFVPVKRRSGNLIEALETARRGVARGAQRRSPYDIDKMTMLGAAASGNPGVLAVPVANGLIRTRLPSTTAAATRGAARALENRTAGSSTTRLMQLLENLREEEDEP
jgi:hypothetical protein